MSPNGDDSDLSSPKLPPEPSEVQSLLEQWPVLSLEDRRHTFHELPRLRCEELFLALSARDQAELIREVSTLEKRSWVRLLAPDDVADLIQELGSDCKSEMLDLLDPQTRREVTALLAYEEDKAGGLMSSRFVRLRPEMSVDEAISYLRIQIKDHFETIYYAFVLDSDQSLLGVVSYRELFLASPQKQIRQIMKSDVIKVSVGMDQEQVAKVFNQANLMAIPVVDEWNHMKGIVTFDDVASVVTQEATEDIQKIGGSEVLDAPYMKTSYLEMLRKRAGWLIVLFVSEMFTATAIGYYQHEIERAIVLTFFIPLIISAGGNSGSQASTLIIRAMALGEVRVRDWWRIMGREIRMGLSLGFILGLVGLIRILAWPSRETLYGEHYALIGFTVAFSVLGCVLWGTIAGSLLPIGLRRIGLDPATASAPFVATLVDVTGIMIYFTVAAVILSGTLL